MQLWVARHGEAVDPDEAATDFDRTLSDRGRRQVGELARWLATRTVLPELIWHSPLVRARQTAQAFAAEWPVEIPLEESPAMAPACAANISWKPFAVELWKASSASGISRMSASASFRRAAVEWPMRPVLLPAWSSANCCCPVPVGSSG